MTQRVYVQCDITDEQFKQLIEKKIISYTGLIRIRDYV